VAELSRLGQPDQSGWTTLDRIGAAARKAREYISPWNVVSPTDVAGFAPGGGLVQAWQDSGRGLKNLKAGNYGQAAADYGSMALNTAGELLPVAKLGMAMLPSAKKAGGATMKAYHGSPHEFDAFDPDEVHWFTTKDVTAEAFGKNRDGLYAPSQGGNATEWHNNKPFIYEVNLPEGRFSIVDPMAEATHAAKEANIPAPQTWDEAAEILRWAEAQRGWIDEARASGKGGVIFKNVGDDPNGVLSDHIAVVDPSLIEMVSKSRGIKVNNELAEWSKQFTWSPDKYKGPGK